MLQHSSDLYLGRLVALVGFQADFLGRRRHVHGHASEREPRPVSMGPGVDNEPRTGAHTIRGLPNGNTWYQIWYSSRIHAVKVCSRELPSK